jgi:hypothetical protein
MKVLVEVAARECTFFFVVVVASQDDEEFCGLTQGPL